MKIIRICAFLIFVSCISATIRAQSSRPDPDGTESADEFAVLIQSFIENSGWPLEYKYLIAYTAGGYFLSFELDVGGDNGLSGDDILQSISGMSESERKAHWQASICSPELSEFLIARAQTDLGASIAANEVIGNSEIVAYAFNCRAPEPE